MKLELGWHYGFVIALGASTFEVDLLEFFVNDDNVG